MKEKQEVFNLYKRLGETPLERLERLRSAHPELGGAPLTYAGRLDPMAEGVLVALAGEGCKRKDEYLRLDKEYEFEVMWGFSSDTHDLLGLAEFIALPGDDPALPDGRLREFEGTRLVEYPAFSSKPVGGRPLFEIAREGGLGAVDMPKREATVHLLERIGGSSVRLSDAYPAIAGRIGRVQGDFRQDAALASWARALATAEAAGMPEILITKYRASVGSGTYIRSLADSMGAAAGCGGLAWSIVRTKAGDLTVGDSEG